MNANHKWEYVTDILCGDMEEGECADLDLFLQENPELAGEADFLARVWHDLALVDVPEPESELLERMGRDIMDKLLSGELTDDELDLAAGGAGLPNFPPQSLTNEWKEEP